MKLIGSHTSPYVRKVLACLALKGLQYEIDPIVPFFGDERFSQMSPLRRIPVLIDGDLTLCDSSVICAYLDEAYPGHPLLPATVSQRTYLGESWDYVVRPQESGLQLRVTAPPLQVHEVGEKVWLEFDPQQIAVVN